jgi:hypothetical protein
MQVQDHAVRSAGADRGGERRRVIDHEEIAGREEARQIAEVGVDEPQIVPIRYEQADAIASQSPHFWRSVCLEFLGKLEIESRKLFQIDCATHANSRAR